MNEEPTLDEVLTQVTDWGVATFPDEDSDGRILHIKKEWDELVRKPDSGEEMADIVMIVANHARAMGVDLKAEIIRKLAINRGRTWVKGPDGVVEHVR